MKKLLFALLFLLLLVSSAQAVTYYVAKTGGGSTCSLASPCLTIAAGIAKLSAGDTLLVRAGTYTETITTAPTGTTIAAYPGNCVTAGVRGPGGGCEAVKINGSAGPSVALVDLSGSSGVTVDGFELDATNSQYGFKPGPNNIFKNLNVHDATGAGSGTFPFAGQGVEINVAGNGSQILNSLIHDNGKFLDTNGDGRAGHGIYNQASNTIIDGNEIYNNGHEGIQLYCNVGGGDNCTGGQSNNIVRNNRIHDNGLNVPDCGITMFSNVTGAKPHQLYNNLIYNNRGNGVCTDNAAGSGQIVYSNTIYGNGASNNGFGLTLGHGSGHIIKNNIAWNNSSQDFYQFNVGGSATADHNLCANLSQSGGFGGTPCSQTTNPLFVKIGRAHV